MLVPRRPGPHVTPSKSTRKPSCRHPYRKHSKITRVEAETNQEAEPEQEGRRRRTRQLKKGNREMEKDYTNDCAPKTQLRSTVRHRS
ncbi:hypothetical protein R1flu_021947 [Riccia fluitans]|uniref:Uncharacterized protein n=1 Tax=Riccia fluitans TaxID=41844 RepID=A0ABD1ZQV9_9MARC